MKPRKIKDLFMGGNIAGYYPKGQSKYFLFIEKGVCLDDPSALLIELHEDIGDMTDYIETLQHNWNMNTPLEQITFSAIKQLSSYELD